MDETNQSSLFELTLDHESIDHLTETARWGKFLAIVGFVGCGIIVIAAFFIGSLLSASLLANSNMPVEPPVAKAISTLGGVFIGAVYFVFAAIYFFPCLFLYNFSVRMKAAINTNDQVKLNQSLKAQKFLFRYVGILTLIGVVLGVIEMVIFGGIAMLALLHR
ncbi:MAG TPA: hypothetical protein VFE32_12460 [Puia sp.]|jgi:hypothetical protein|nr:hypothetical protein [Puia sp.]